MGDWIAYDTAPGRLIPWLPIAFGLGVVLYFAADREPFLWAGVTLTAVAVSLCIMARARPLAFPVAVAAAAIAFGFTLAAWKTARIAHPILAAPAFNVTLSGFVETREERERSDRIVIRVHAMSGARPDIKLERVRVSVRKGMAPPVASFVELRARLNPPLSPLRPGGYDFARDHYFSGSAPPASFSALSNRLSRPNRRGCGCAMPRPSVRSGTQSMHGFARPFRGIKVRLHRR